MHTELEAALAAWDGKRVALLEQLYDRFSGHSEFTDWLLALSLGPQHSVGATWLYKLWCERGGKSSTGQSETLLTLLSQSEHWQTRLHVLQMLPYFEISQAVQPSLYDDLTLATRAENKFERAWAYNGLALLAGLNSRYLPETRAMLERAQREEAASVKARVRQILKQLES